MICHKSKLFQYSRIKLAMLSCSNNTYKDSIGRIDHCTCNYITNIGNVFEMGDLIAMSYPKYYVQVNGLTDYLFPIGGGLVTRP